MDKVANKFSIRDTFTKCGKGRGIADLVIKHLQDTVGITVTRRAVYQAGQPNIFPAYKAEIVAALEYLRDTKLKEDTDERIRKIKGLPESAEV